MTLRGKRNKKCDLTLHKCVDSESRCGDRLVDFFFFFPPQFLGITPLLKLANLTDDQFAGKTHPHADTHILTQLIQPERRCRYLHQTGVIVFYLRHFYLSFHMQSNRWTHTHTYTHVHFPPHDKHAAWAVRCPVATATQCLGNQQGWRRLFPDRWCVCVCVYWQVSVF